MNRRGQMVLVNIMLAMLVFITAIIMIDPIKDFTSLGRTNLNCSNSASLPTGERMTCIILDTELPLFIGIVMGIGLAYLGAKKYGFIDGGG